MPAFVTKMLDHILEWWKKFNTKQRVILISIAAAVLVALGILAFVVTRPTWVTIYTADDMKEASEISSLLTGDSMTYQTLNSGLTFQVHTEDEADACYLLAENDYPSEPYSIDNVTSGSFSQTESDKQKLYKNYLEEKFESHIGSFSFVNSATVDITLPDDDGTILSQEGEGTAAIQLDLKNDIDTDQAYGIALFVATELGNEDTSGVTVLDSDGNVLYSGSDSDSNYTTASSQLNNTQKLESAVSDKVKQVLVGTQMFANIEIGVNLDVSYADSETATHEYYGNEDGANTNMIDSTSEYTAESNGGSSAIPGTDSNDDDTTYYVDDEGNTYYTVSDTSTQYLTNERVNKTTTSGATVNKDTSSIAVAAVTYKTYDEDTLEAAGELDDMTYEEYKAAHSEPVLVDVDQSYIDLIASTTGLSTDSISFVCYQQPIFEDTSSGGVSTSDILQIVMAVIIFVLLGYVVFKSTRKQYDIEPEPEISVETLLEATAEEQNAMNDIGYSEKSETRILIEKFVEENPDAVALLLRNWLNEDWE